MFFKLFSDVRNDHSVSFGLHLGFAFSSLFLSLLDIFFAQENHIELLLVNRAIFVDIDVLQALEHFFLGKLWNQLHQSLPEFSDRDFTIAIGIWESKKMLRSQILDPQLLTDFIRKIGDPGPGSQRPV